MHKCAVKKKSIEGAKKLEGNEIFSRCIWIEREKERGKKLGTISTTEEYSYTVRDLVQYILRLWFIIIKNFIFEARGWVKIFFNIFSDNSEIIEGMPLATGWF